LAAFAGSISEAAFFMSSYASVPAWERSESGVPGDFGGWAAVALEGSAVVLRGSAVVLRGSAVVLRGSADLGIILAANAVVRRQAAVKVDA